MSSLAYTSSCPLRPRVSRRTHYPQLAFASAAIAASSITDSEPFPVKPLQSLGPTERVVDVIVATTSNLLNGAIYGALFGLFSGAWSTRSFSGAFAEARANSRSWGVVSGVYAGLQTASKVIRNRDDRVNSIVGACGSGAAFTAKAGPRAAMQGCASFAALSYLIDVLTAPKEASQDAQDPNSPEVILRKKR